MGEHLEYLPNRIGKKRNIEKRITIIIIKKSIFFFKTYTTTVGNRTQAPICGQLNECGGQIFLFQQVWKNSSISFSLFIAISATQLNFTNQQTGQIKLGTEFILEANSTSGCRFEEWWDLSLTKQHQNTSFK
jgi:hypothetical protein